VGNGVPDGTRPGASRGYRGTEAPKMAEHGGHD
jgi:hypothetical protein